MCFIFIGNILSMESIVLQLQVNYLPLYEMSVYLLFLNVIVII